MNLNGRAGFAPPLEPHLRETGFGQNHFLLHKLFGEQWGQRHRPYFYNCRTILVVHLDQNQSALQQQGQQELLEDMDQTDLQLYPLHIHESSH